MVRYCADRVLVAFLSAGEVAIDRAKEWSMVCCGALLHSACVAADWESQKTNVSSRKINKVESKQMSGAHELY